MLPTPFPGGARRRRPLVRAAAAALALAAATVLATPLSGQASPRADTDAPGAADKLSRLEERARQLTEDYDGTLVKLEEAQRSVRRAQSRADRLTRRLDRNRAEAAELAAARYKSGRVPPALRIMLGSDPSPVLYQTAVPELLSRNHAALLRRLQSMTAEAEAARRETRQRIAELGRRIEKLEKRKERVAALIERYEGQPPSSASGLGRLTARMGRVQRLATDRFNLPHGVNCYRPDDSGEHPEGRACDFMLSSGGAMPSDAAVQRGHALASWARSNASRLGVMYIIYRQRIWDARTGGGWERMEDRGSITANHYDHVHISVF